ncbi:uncharacterized protein [Pyxicephalus adspersus]|uniref:uncharacterized protein n=1 Tax=Pyxicephalus adspersus TaxID=30357 RepID=UPI003B5A7D45
MLRWKRFCRHTKAMEECYPHYQKQVGYVMQEYFDAVQRAQRLAIAREHLITGQKNSIHLVTLEDLIIYVQWLICHLHSVKPIFTYIRTLQHLPVSNLAETVIESHYKEKQCQSLMEFKTVNSSEQNSAEDTKWEDYESLPQHQTETQKIKPVLQDLLSNFKIDYDTDNLKNTANEMELLSLVTSKFRSIFKKQQTMRTFPLYDSGMETKDGWGFKGPHMAFKKTANWLPFIKVTSAEKAMEVLQEHAAQVIQPSPAHNVSMKNSLDIWVKIYNPLDLPQDVLTNNGSSLHESSEKDIDITSLIKRPASSRQKKDTGFNYQNTLQLLGLDEAEDNSKDPVMMKGAYLSLLYLSHLRVRELQLVDCYYEAYQHVCDPEERTALAQVITDIMYQRPRFDIGSKYFLEAYRDECQCLRLHLELVRSILNNQFHPSLGMAYLIPKTLEYINEEFLHNCNAKTPKEIYSVEKKVLELALNEWSVQKDLQSSFTANVQKDLFEGVLVEDPIMVRDICMLALNSADEEKKHGTAKQIYILETFSKMLELITLRHRIIETSLETALLSRTYTYFAEEMGFNEFHLHLRPVRFEFATYKAQIEQIPPTFITSLLEDDSSVDRYSPSAQLLAIHEVDDNQIGKFSFWTKDGILQLLSKDGVENLQVVLSCQVIQKNALIAATQLASFCQMSSWITKQVTDIPILQGDVVPYRMSYSY